MEDGKNSNLLFNMENRLSFNSQPSKFFKASVLPKHTKINQSLARKDNKNVDIGYFQFSNYKKFSATNVKEVLENMSDDSFDESISSSSYFNISSGKILNKNSEKSNSL